jgi:cell division transport system permease protein
LRSIKSWIDFHKQAAKSSFKFLKKEPVTTTMTIFVIAIILVLSSLFWILSDAFTSITSDWQSSGQISLYLDIPTSAADEVALLAKVRATKGVGLASLKTSSDALVQLQAQAGMQDILSYLPSNPLPSVIDIVPASDINTPDSLNKLQLILKNYPHVALAKIDMEWINRVFLFLKLIKNLLNFMMLMLSLVAVLIIGNTLRLIINDRHEEILVLKFIGAGDPFIMRPYLYSGIWYGLFAAIFAIVCINLLLLSLQTGINDLFVTYKIHYTVSSLSYLKACVLLFSAAILGWIGARISVKRHLLKTT